MSRITRKWRPPLTLVIGGTLAAVLCLPLVGVVYFRLAGDILGWSETGWLIGWMAVAATAVLAFLLWRLVLRPVTALTQYARALKAGEAKIAPPDHFGTPEFGALGESVIAMGETLNSRAASLRAYADHVTHELKSPLTSLRGAAELLQADLPAADRAKLIETIDASAERMQALLTQLQRHAAASQSSGAGTSNLSDLPAEIAGVRLDVGAGGVVPLSASDLRVLMDQMAQNAAAHGAKVITVRWNTPLLRLADDGQGVAAGNAGRIFDPFFTTRRGEGGTGMGLAIVKTLLAARGAQISLARDGTASGAVFEVSFD